MNILIKWIFKAEQAFYATTIRFFPTLAINQGLLSDWNDSRLTCELNQYRKTCRELKELLNRTQQLPGFQGQLERWLTRAEDKEYIRTQQKLVRVEDHNRKARSEARQKRSNAYDELVKFFVRHPDLWKMVTEVTWELLQSHSLIYLLNAVKLYRDSSLAPDYGQGDTLPQSLLLALERLIKIRLSDIRAYACARDDVWYCPEDDHYHTTRQVRISTPELQHPWNSGSEDASLAHE